MSGRYGLEIRAAASADAAGLAELTRSAGVAMTVRLLAERLEAVLAQPGAALLALEWGPPSGVIVLHWYAALDRDDRTAVIDTLLVDREQRRRGIGRLLLKAGAQAARQAGCGTLLIAMAAGSPGLDAFCRATGFTGDGDLLRRPLHKRRRSGDGDPSG